MLIIWRATGCHEVKSILAVAREGIMGSANGHLLAGGMVEGTAIIYGLCYGG